MIVTDRTRRNGVGDQREFRWQWRPVSWRRGRMRSATFMRRLISLRGMRSRAQRLSISPLTIPTSSGGSAIWPTTRYISPRLVRSCVSRRSAISTRNALPTSSEHNFRISA